MNPTGADAITGVGVVTEYRIEPGALRIRDLPTQIRPREEMDRVGAENLSDASLLAILLKTGSKGMNVIELSTRLLRKYSSLTGLASTTVDELCGKHKTGASGRHCPRSSRAPDAHATISQCARASSSATHSVVSAAGKAAAQERSQPPQCSTER